MEDVVVVVVVGVEEVVPVAAGKARVALPLVAIRVPAGV